MSERQVTMAYCPHCDQPVQPSQHTTIRCLLNVLAQRDEARESGGVAERANAMHIEALETCRLERDKAEVKLQQAAFFISEAMKRLENDALDAAYHSLKTAVSWIDGPLKECGKIPEESSE